MSKTKEASIVLGFFPINLSENQCSNTGMAMVLILLLIGFFTANILLYELTIPVLLINMIYPKFFYPIGIVWLGLSRLLGTIMSTIILTLTYILLVIPVGMIRKLAGKDDLQLSNFKKSSDSVLVERNHTYTPDDLKTPY